MQPWFIWMPLMLFTRLAWLLRSWVALGVLAIHLAWFDQRSRGDERHLAERFGDSYLEYCRRVKRWIPGVY